MSYRTYQKAIKIGTSLGITLPAKDVKRLGIQPGTMLRIDYTIEQPISRDQLESEALTEQLIKLHQKALKNLSRKAKDAKS